jgi:hypothetical protein
MVVVNLSLVGTWVKRVVRLAISLPANSTYVHDPGIANVTLPTPFGLDFFSMELLFYLVCGNSTAKQCRRQRLVRIFCQLVGNR